MSWQDLTTDELSILANRWWGADRSPMREPALQRAKRCIQLMVGTLVANNMEPEEPLVVPSQRGGLLVSWPCGLHLRLLRDGRPFRAFTEWSDVEDEEDWSREAEDKFVDVWLAARLEM